MAAAQLHVSLKYPMFVKISGEPVPFRSFDGTRAPDSDSIMYSDSMVCFNAMKLYAARPGADHISMRIRLEIPHDNLAGIVEQPFEKG